MSSAAIPRSSWVKLYKQLQQEANKIPQYNYRSFFNRRIRDHFEKNRTVSDLNKQHELYQEGLRNLEVLKRQSLVCQLYPHKKTVVEQKLEIDVEKTLEEVAQFQAQYKDLVERNRRRLDEDQQWVEDNLREERAMKQRINSINQQDTKENEKNSAVTDTKAIMDELRDSNVAAEVILDRERKKQIEKELEEKEEQEKRKKRNKELLQNRKRQAENMSFTSTMRIAGRPYVHQNLDLVINGPQVPTFAQIESMGYLSHMRQASMGRIAGGYTATMGVARALFESRLDLLAF
ncbi:unnamed protein product [Caenorhabditis bovis]|uniref:Uncharacterized protein n=1 Tax=Caenorhabditis bovis TaxID=2654633 RepID=A0A8S1EVE1_9PELO|nr:unnamed protein product [Caenorhabditis bovis]